MCIRDRGYATVFIYMATKTQKGTTERASMAKNTANYGNDSIRQLKDEERVRPVSYTHLDVYKRQVLDLDGAVTEGGVGDELTLALARLVDGVGQDLEGGVRAAVEPVRAEDDGGADVYKRQAWGCPE